MRISDWSSDGCSSDLRQVLHAALLRDRHVRRLRERVLPGLEVTTQHLVHEELGVHVIIRPLRLAQVGLDRSLDGRQTTTQREIGRASGRERVGQYVYVPVADVKIKKKIK